MESYAIDAPTWRAYQPLLGSDMRLEADNLPAESTWAWRGLDVHLDRYDAPETDLTVIVCHGAGGYGRLLAPVGRIIHEFGHAVVLPDLPGYGLTRVAPSRMRYPLWVDLVADLARAERAHTGRPVVLLGMSMGGMLALHAAAAAPAGTVSGLIATTLIDPREPDTRAAVSRLPGARRFSGLLGLVPPNLRLPMPWLAHVRRMSSLPAVNELCVRDRQGGGNRVPLGFLRSWLTYAPAREPHEFDRCPVLLAHPAADRWTPSQLSTRTLQRLACPTRYVELERCEHFPIEEPGVSTLRTATAAFLADVIRDQSPPSTN
jgi:alpha-beta hydrolase superfamily lysophospholipase